MDKDLEKLITKIVDARLEQIVKKVDILQSTVDNFGSQLDDDRKEIGDIKLAVNKNLAVSEGTREDLHDQTKVVSKKIQENLQDVSGMVSNAVEEGIEKTKKKWWQIFKKGVK